MQFKKYLEGKKFLKIENTTAGNLNIQRRIRKNPLILDKISCRSCVESRTKTYDPKNRKEY